MPKHNPRWYIIRHKHTFEYLASEDNGNKWMPKPEMANKYASLEDAIRDACISEHVYECTPTTMHKVWTIGAARQ
jgi:hypothetical protein